MKAHLSTLILATAVTLSSWGLLGCGDDGSDPSGGITEQDSVGFAGNDGDTGPATRSDTSTTAPTPDTNTNADAGGTGPADTARGQDVGQRGGGPDAPVGEDTRGRQVAIELGGGIVLSEVQSEFLDVATAAARFTETSTAVEGTVFGDCVVGPSALDAAAVQYGYDAGAITVSGTTPAVTLTPASEGANGTGYTSSLSDGAESFLPAGGALVTLAAAGGADLAAFEMYVQMPEHVAMTSPVTGLFASTSISSDMIVTWNAGNGDQVVVTVSPLSSSFQPTAGDAVLCVLDADTGNVTVQAAALQAVGAGNAAVTVTRLKTGNAEVPGYVVPAVVTRSTGGPVSLE